MPDDNLPTQPPQPSPGFQPDVPPGGNVPPPPPVVSERVTANPAPAPAADQPRPTVSAGDVLKSALNWLLSVAAGGAIGAVAGLVLFLLLWLTNHNLGYQLCVGGGALLGVFFHRFVLRTVGLTKKDPAAEAKAAAARAPGKAPADAPQADSFREVIETVVFVVVLVLLLKSYTAEAFVIPTGSMAETLLGYQKEVVCPQCGHEFPVNCSSQVDPQNGPPSWVRGCTCPNCRQHIRFSRPDKQYGPNQQDGDQPPNGVDSIWDPPWSSGDRVLVAKFNYDLFEGDPDRLDVVVFKYPGDDSFPAYGHGPNKDHVPMNYIKRLIGKPGETIAIHDGDLYILSPEQGLKYDDLKDVTDPDKRKWGEKQLWQKKHQHQDDPEALRLFDARTFVILRKAPENILAMKRIVYDNDHPAKDLAAIQPPRWSDRDTAAAVWAADKDNSFRVAPADDRVHWLSYHHILRDHGDKPQLITDFMGYNTWEPHQTPGENWVGDLILECEVAADKPQGELTLELSKGPDRFRARFDLGNGFCKLLRVDKDDKEEELAPPGKLTGCKGGGTHRLRFANVDQRLTVWVDDALPFGEGVGFDPPVGRDGKLVEGPDQKNDLEPASVGLQGSGATLKHIKLWRDTYYTTQHWGDPPNPSVADARANVDFSDSNTWGPLRKLPVKTLYVQPGHYLCLGDNSPESSDGRSWGLVPQRLLLGKALLVYYPFNRFGHIR